MNCRRRSDLLDISHAAEPERAIDHECPISDPLIGLGLLGNSSKILVEFDVLCLFKSFVLLLHLDGSYRILFGLKVDLEPLIPSVDRGDLVLCDDEVPN